MTISIDNFSPTEVSAIDGEIVTFSLDASGGTDPTGLILPTDVTPYTAYQGSPSAVSVTSSTCSVQGTSTGIYSSALSIGVDPTEIDDLKASYTIDGTKEPFWTHGYGAVAFDENDSAETLWYVDKSETGKCIVIAGGSLVETYVFDTSQTIDVSVRMYRLGGRGGAYRVTVTASQGAQEVVHTGISFVPEYFSLAIAAKSLCTTNITNIIIEYYTHTVVWARKSTGAVIATGNPATIEMGAYLDGDEIVGTVTSGGDNVSTPDIPVSVLHYTNQAVSQQLTEGDTLEQSWSWGGAVGESTVTRKKNDQIVDGPTTTTDTTITYSKTAELADVGSYTLEVVNNGRVLVSNTITVTVSAIPVPTEKEDGDIRYLLEISKKIGWNPTLSTSTSYLSEFGVISKFAILKTEVSNYWTGWGGTYDCPTSTNLEVFLSQFLQRVQSKNAMLLTANSFFIDVQESSVFLNTPVYPWQYYRQAGSVAEAYGFSTTVSNPLDPSNDEYSGIRYPTRFNIPKIPVSDLPDPINGVLVNKAFSVSLINDDGYFDLTDFSKLFNSPIRIKKSSKQVPSLEDFETVAYGLISDQKITQTTYTIKIGELFRMLDEPVTRTITAVDFPTADEAIGKNIPIAWGAIFGGSLIQVDSAGTQYIVCDNSYLTDVVAVYDRDGNEIPFDLNNGIITVSEDSNPDSCDFIGRQYNRIGDIVISEVSEKSGIAYVDGVWDVVETEKFRSTSNRISMYVDSGTVRDLVAKCLKNDTAFFMTKNDGRATIRQWGMDYNTWIIDSWKITQFRDKDFTTNKYFCSSVQVGFDYTYSDKSDRRTFLYDSEENSVLATYNKTQRLEYSTQLLDENSAKSLAGRLFRRQSKRGEIITIAISGNTAKINRLDRIVAKIAIGNPERLMTKNLQWIVRYVDPTQDLLILESGDTDTIFTSGLLSDQITINASGLLAEQATDTASGLLSNIGTI